MKKLKNGILLVMMPLILTGCDNSNSHSSEMIDSSTESSFSSESSSKEIQIRWAEKDRDLIIRYAGSLLPYPSNFSDKVTVREISDMENNRTYLEILDESDVFNFADYHLDLENDGWTGIKNYNGSLAQSDNSGNLYYEFVKKASDNSLGFDLTYFHSLDTETSTQYNVIQCFNDLETEIDKNTDWNDEAKATLENALTEIPPFLKFGKTNRVYQSNQNAVYCYDGYVEDLTKENVKILEEDGYVLDTDLSKEKSRFTLSKTLANNSKITAEVYYFSGNYVLFEYHFDVKETSSWPSYITDSFKEKTEYDLPTFSAGDITSYYSYSKENENVIYAYTDDTSILDKYTSKLMESGLIYDYERQWYVNWHENYYVKAYFATDSVTSKNAMFVLFATLSSPYDKFVEGWPSDTISKFLTDNEINVEYPTFDVSELSKYTDYRIETSNYSDQYDYYYKMLKLYPDYFDIDPNDEEAIVAKATSMAKNNTYTKIQIYDQAVKVDNGGVYADIKYPVLDYLKDTLTKACWCSVESDVFTEGAFEDAYGKLLIGFDYAYGVTTMTFTFGSGILHTPTFKFADSSLSLRPGNIYNLQLDVQMLPYDITFESDNEKIAVDNNGKVTVSSDAKSGEEATITAKMNIPNEGEKIATCKIIVNEGYDIKSAIDEVANKYNSYFNLNDLDVGFAKPYLVDKSDPEIDYVFKYYEMVIPTDFATLDETKSFVTENLIPAGFKDPNDGQWSDPQEYADGITKQSVTYSWYDEDYNGVQLIFFAYLDPTTNVPTIMVKSLA